jgi:hypothetical protein
LTTRTVPKTAPGAAKGHRGGKLRARRALPWMLWGLATVLIAGGLVALDRVYQRREGGGTPVAADPASRVAGGIRSISGTDAVRKSDYDPATKKALVEVSSRYYDAKKSVKDNREYLATEGRLGAQLALFGNDAVTELTVRLYGNNALLATVVARPNQKFEEMKVEYSGPLAQR